MTNLTERAEKALLGALLTDPASIRQTALVEPRNFAAPVHQQIHAALVPRQPDRYTGWAGSMSANAAYARARGAVADGYLHELVNSCPDPSHADMYARMVMEASLRRQLGVYALRLKYEAADMHHELNRLQEVQPEGLDLPGIDDAHFDPQRLFSHQMRLSYVLQAHARAFDPSTAAPAVATDGLVTSTLSGHVAASAARGWASVTSPHVTEHDWHALDEEQVLAGIIQNCAPADDFPTWLPAEAFTSGSRREIYDALIGIYYRDDPIDPLILDWELAKRHSATSIQAPAEAPPPPDPRYIADLSARPIGAVLFLDACQSLLSNHLQALQHQAMQTPAPPVHGPVQHALPRPGDQPLLEPPTGYLSGPNHQPRM
jgi:hypothetical protein